LSEDKKAAKIVTTAYRMQYEITKYREKSVSFQQGKTDFQAARPNLNPQML